MPPAKRARYAIAALVILAAAAAAIALPSREIRLFQCDLRLSLTPSPCRPDGYRMDYRIVLRLVIFWGGALLALVTTWLPSKLAGMAHKR